MKTSADYRDVTGSRYQYEILCIGVNHSLHGCAPLRAAARDAEDVSRLFSYHGYWDTGRNVCLTGPRASSHSIQTELKRIATAPPDDLLIIYWAGHMGTVRNAHRLVTEAPGDFYGTQTIALDLLQHVFYHPTTTRNRVLILDTCQSGEAVHFVHPSVKRLSDRARVAVLAACASDAQAREKARNGCFTELLLKQLKRPAPKRRRTVDLMELFNATADEAIAIDQEQIYMTRGTGRVHMRIPVLSQASLLE